VVVDASARRIAVLALLAAYVVSALVAVDVGRNRDGDPVVDLLLPGAESPAAGVLADDFGAHALGPGVGHDGQFFYAVARQPMHPRAAAEDLDRPRYRLQRPLFPVLGWALHPWGGGRGLVVALLVVNVTALVAVGVLAGRLSVRLGGSPWPAAIALAPGAFFAMRLTTADLVALALMLLAILLAIQRRTAGAAGAGALTVLAREVSLAPLLGLAVAKRGPASRAPALAGAVVGGLWWLVLRATVPARGDQIIELGPPLRGLRDATELWLQGEDVVAGAWVWGCLLLGIACCVRTRMRHVLAWPLAAQIVLTTLLSVDVVQPVANATRVTLPLWALAVIMAATPDRTVDLTDARVEPVELSQPEASDAVPASAATLHQ